MRARGSPLPPGEGESALSSREARAITRSGEGARVLRVRPPPAPSLREGDSSAAFSPLPDPPARTRLHPMATPPNLTLVGAPHRDPAGYRRLLALLRREKPDRVSVEVSRASLRYRRGAGASRRRAIAREASRFPPGAPLREEAREVAAVLRLPF